MSTELQKNLQHSGKFAPHEDNPLYGIQEKGEVIKTMVQSTKQQFAIVMQYYVKNLEPYS